MEITVDHWIMLPRDVESVLFVFFFPEVMFQDFFVCRFLSVETTLLGSCRMFCLGNPGYQNKHVTL